jgi:iron-sulfur cluster assembly protein
MAFHMTTAAAQEILAAAQRSGADGMALRVAAKPTPDGLAYGMGFDDAAPDDEVAVFDGLTVLIAPPSREPLAGTVLDFVELDGGGRDFIFMPQKSGSDSNFSEKRGCGSGGCSRCG